MSGVRRRSGSQGLRSPAAKRPLSAPVALQGWLHKQGSEGLMLWKKRWFVLSEYCLFYYKGQTCHVFLPLELSVAFFPPKNLFHLLPFSLFLSLSFSPRFVFGTKQQDTIPNAIHATRNSSGFIENTCCFFPFVPPFSLFQRLFSRNSKYERGKSSLFGSRVSTFFAFS